MSTLKTLRFALTPYTDAHERRVGKFFDGLREHSSRIEVRHQLMKLLQSNIALINLWTEYRYKGYVYLKKSERKKLYRNLVLIAEDFEAYRSAHETNAQQLQTHVAEVAEGARPEISRLSLLAAMMSYLSPGGGRYEYRASSSFGRLLRNPTLETLVGDCNQIVTLYIYLYSRYHDVGELKIRLLPEHVALHFQGVDIEATTGRFANYRDKKGASLQPIEEIVSVNLLDISDEHFAKHTVPAKEFLQASRFAYILSHDREIVTRNLEAAYIKLVNTALGRNDYGSALTMAKQSRDVQLLSVVGHNGALYYMKQHEFAKSRQFAEHALKRADLLRDSYQAEGVYLYEKQQYHAAIKAFERHGDRQLVARCYEALFFEEQRKLSGATTVDQLQAHKSTIRRMSDYAKKSGNKQLIEHASSLKKYI